MIEKIKKEILAKHQIILEKTNDNGKCIRHIFYYNDENIRLLSLYHVSIEVGGMNPLKNLTDYPTINILTTDGSDKFDEALNNMLKEIMLYIEEYQYTPYKSDTRYVA